MSWQNDKGLYLGSSLVLYVMVWQSSITWCSYAHPHHYTRNISLSDYALGVRVFYTCLFVHSNIIVSTTMLIGHLSNTPYIEIHPFPIPCIKTGLFQCIRAKNRKRKKLCHTCSFPHHLHHDGRCASKLVFTIVFTIAYST